MSPAALTEATVTVPGTFGATYDLTPGVIDTHACGAFLNGQCHALALALSEATGWPVVALLGECQGELCRYRKLAADVCACQIWHFVVENPDGWHIDISGAHAPGTVPDCEALTAVPASHAMWAYMAGAIEWRAPAIDVARTFVAPLLAALPPSRP